MTPHEQAESGTHEVQRIANDAVRSLPEVARTDAGRDDLARYLEALLERNQQVNLVSRRDTIKHIERFTQECVFLGQLLIDDSKRLGVRDPRLLDLGSGGGFPGMVLKTLLPHLEVTLVEATQKKARFLAETCEALDLRRVTVIAARAEALSDRGSRLFRPELRHEFDWVTAKALGPISDSLHLAAPFLRIDGVHWTFKGSGVHEETLAAGRVLKQLRFKPFRVDPIPGFPASYVASFRRLAQIDPRAR